MRIKVEGVRGWGLRVLLTGKIGAPVGHCHLEAQLPREQQGMGRPRAEKWMPKRLRISSRDPTSAPFQRELENGPLESLTGAHGQIICTKVDDRTARGKREQLSLPHARAGQPQAQKVSGVGVGPFNTAERTRRQRRGLFHM